MESLAKFIKSTRIKKGLLVRELSAKLEIDSALVSRYESGQRLPTREQIEKIASVLGIKSNLLVSMWMAEKIVAEVGYGEIAIEALMLAEEKIKYGTVAIGNDVPKSLLPLLKKIDSLKAQLIKKKESLNIRITEAEDVDYTFESNRIEGNTLSLQETAMIVADGITISGKSVREHLEAINHYEAIAFIRELADKATVLKESHILQLHHLVLRGIDRENAGRYRQVPVRITGSSHIPPEPYLVPIQMEELFHWYNQNHQTLHPALLAAEMHERLVYIHPFIDGNGRTARLLMNLILLQNGFIIANISGKSKTRMAYYQALEKARIENNKTEYLNFILTIEMECLERLVNFL